MSLIPKSSGTSLSVQNIFSEKVNAQVSAHWLLFSRVFVFESNMRDLHQKELISSFRLSGVGKIDKVCNTGRTILVVGVGGIDLG